jgi:hypothetical protein
MNHAAIYIDCKFYVRENRSMKNATKKPAKSTKKAAKKAPAKKKK